MALSLSVPTTIRSLPKEVEINPKKAKAWVESLPLTKNDGVDTRAHRNH